MYNTSRKVRIFGDFSGFPAMTDSRNSLANAPYLHEYFGVWCMTEGGAAALYHAAMNLDLQRHLVERQEIVRRQAVEHRMAAGDDGPAYYRTRIEPGGIAVVRAGGTLMKQVPSMSEGTSTVALRSTMRGLARDERVAGVMLMLDSPGGTAAGTLDLAADVAAVARAKPVHVYADSLTASAAYWVASQGNVISAGADAIVGSIGTFAAVYDFSGMAAKEGIKAYVIRRGEFKGMGVPGTELTEKHRDELQRTVDALNEQFLAGVAAGRRVSMDRVRELNDGRVHVGAEAKAIGMVDHIESIDEAMERLRAATVGPKNKSRGGPKAVVETPASAGTNTEDRMSGTNDGTAPDKAGQTQEPPKTPATQHQTAPATPAAEQPKAATAAEIDAACPGASSDFKLDCLRSGHTLAQTKDAFIGWQSAQLRARDEETTKAAAAHAEAIKAKDAELKAKDDQILDLNQRLKSAGGLMETGASEQRGKSDAGNAPADPKVQAEKEWEANFEDCTAKFSTKNNYVAWRTNDLKRSRRR
jgi:signal peptide peptidase SppA